ncbi:type II toxin-antitoxin system RelE/ParE family toxin [Paraferrimonas sedimenticola]|uniref:Toxin n=1 Tax=Paraferrimonas sedimenticola TaxID=375674 RepID=A0AA37RVF8_9GAMM|nr:type II toxin-antitoxin system RelE/ParE family toxin [Paraferrimonas sedimenticola]GLP96001.1 toxin ParE4 [Paraferrimonas sedimenticola]
MPYTLSKKAEQDLISIFVDGAQQFGEMQARKYHSELKMVFELLAENPLANRERVEFFPPIRIHPHKAHLLVYAADVSQGVYFVRILHQREDWRNTTFLGS